VAFLTGPVEHSMFDLSWLRVGSGSGIMFVCDSGWSGLFPFSWKLRVCWCFDMLCSVLVQSLGVFYGGFFFRWLS
jgi:hypothetical protein